MASDQQSVTWPWAEGWELEVVRAPHENRQYPVWRKGQVWRLFNYEATRPEEVIALALAPIKVGSHWACRSFWTEHLCCWDAYGCTLDIEEVPAGPLPFHDRASHYRTLAEAIQARLKQLHTLEIEALRQHLKSCRKAPDPNPCRNTWDVRGSILLRMSTMAAMRRLDTPSPRLYLRGWLDLRVVPTPEGPVVQKLPTPVDLLDIHWRDYLADHEFQAPGTG